MVEEKLTTNSLEFTLNLKSRTKSLRLQEATVKLKQLYPYAIDEASVLIIPTEKKNYYKVVLNSKNEAKKTKLSNVVISIAILFILLLVAFIFINTQINKKKVYLQEQKIIEQENLTKEKETLLLQNKITTLKTNLELIEKERFENIYDRIEILYSLLEGSSIVENLSIDKDKFSLEITTKNSAKLLENFENSNKLTEVKMMRTTVSQKVDFVSLSGVFIKNYSKVDDNLSLKEQIEFLESLLESYEQIAIKKSEQNLSDYIKFIRECAHKNHCNEQYVQVKGENSNLEIEVMLYSSAVDILTFIKEIQSFGLNYYDIKNVKLKNSDDESKLQTVISFLSGIAIKNNHSMESFEDDGIEFTPKEISRSLHKEKIVIAKKNIPINNISKQIPQEKNSTNVKKNLVYIGQTKMNSITYILAKDTQLDSIYKFKFVEKSDSYEKDNICFLDDSARYIARLNNEFYEVRK